MTVADLIEVLRHLPQELPVVVTMGIGEYPTDPSPRQETVWFDASEPKWVVPADDPRGVRVVWL
jgi:hypothetical protein